MSGRAEQIARLLRTTLHLAPSQVWHRLRIDARNRWWELRGPQVDARYRALAARLDPPQLDHPGLTRVAALRCGRSDAATSLATARNALAGRFHFVGRSLDLGTEVAWQRPDLDAGTRLWKTLLHEFSYAVDLARAAVEEGDEAWSERLCDLIESWSAANPIGLPGFASDVWDPRAVSTRMMNWSLAAAILEPQPGDRLHTLLGNQLGLHTLFLRDNLELDLRGNHLLRDYTALVFGHEMLGIVPEALDWLRAELEEQVLADGCHFERSPLYHAIVLQDVIECRELLGERAPDWLRDTGARMAGFLEYLLPPDRNFPLFGDTWHGEVTPERVLVEAGQPRIAPRPGGPEQASGIVALTRGQNRAVLLAGAHAPDYQMGHTHADGLSFEAYRDLQRIVTDSGTSTYDPGAARMRVRSTAAHNTVQIDGQEQLEAWSSFRVGRRGRGRVRARGSDATWDWVWGTHDGYRWLPGQPWHHRLLAVSQEAVLALDWIDGGGEHAVRSALHLHPDADMDAFQVVPISGTCQQDEALLHERFNENRQMTELYVETRSTLPWVGGWLLVFDSEAPIDVQLEANAGHTRITCATGAEGGFSLRWSIANGEVRLSDRPAAIC
jgi:uncharacterized heparinase superfamily protein